VPLAVSLRLRRRFARRAWLRLTARESRQASACESHKMHVQANCQTVSHKTRAAMRRRCARCGACDARMALRDGAEAGRRGAKADRRACCR
jgi:hypothetical protein